MVDGGCRDISHICERCLDYRQKYTIGITLKLKCWPREVTSSDIIEDVMVNDSDDVTEVT